MSDEVGCGNTVRSSIVCSRVLTALVEEQPLLRGRGVKVGSFVQLAPTPREDEKIEVQSIGTVRSRYKRIIYKRIWVASLPFQSV